MIDKIKIGWKEYDIVEKDIDDSLVEVKAERYGEIDCHKQVIYINKDATEECKKETLIHEIIHGVDEMYYIGLDEKTVGKLSTGLFTVLKDNNLEIVKKQ